MRTLKDIKSKLNAQFPQTLNRHYVQQYDCYMDIITKETALFLSTEEILFRQLFKGGSIKRLPEKMEELFRDAVLIPDLKKQKITLENGAEKIVMVDETETRFISGIAYKYWRQFSYPGTAVYTKPGSSMYILMDKDSQTPMRSYAGSAHTRKGKQMRTINMVQIIGFHELKRARQYVIFYTNKKSECRGSWHSLEPKEQRFILRAYKSGRWSRNFSGRLFMHEKTPSDDFSTIRTQRARMKELYKKNYGKQP